MLHSCTTRTWPGSATYYTYVFAAHTHIHTLYVHVQRMYIVSTWPALSATDKGNFAPPPPATASPYPPAQWLLQLAYNLHCCLFPFAYFLPPPTPFSHSACCSHLAGSANFYIDKFFVILLWQLWRALLCSALRSCCFSFWGKFWAQGLYE